MSDMNVILPAEWAPQECLWVGWPHLAEEWGGSLTCARNQIADFIRAANEYTTIKVAAGSEDAHRSAVQMLGNAAKVLRVPTGDIWLRDTGPIITLRGSVRQAEVFQFNGWGGKFVMPGDTETAMGIAKLENLSMRSNDIILEGGAIESDGAGRLLTTRQCLLSDNRNDWNATEADHALRKAFCVDDVIWLGDGLLNDHTDGHVDNIARFIGPGHALCQMPSGEDDPNAATLLGIEDDLRNAGLNVSTIPSPGRIVSENGEVIPASHMNFTITNGAIIMPIYEDHFSHVALAELRALVPEMKVIGLPATEILKGGGSFHCMSREIPMG